VVENRFFIKSSDLNEVVEKYKFNNSIKDGVKNYAYIINIME
jgi:hypothetical protein